MSPVSILILDELDHVTPNSRVSGLNLFLTSSSSMRLAPSSPTPILLPPHLSLPRPRLQKMYPFIFHHIHLRSLRTSSSLV
jgi:hypothetical protein